MEGVVNYVDSHIFSLFKASSLSCSLLLQFCYSSYLHDFKVVITYTILSRKPLKDNSNIENYDLREKEPPLWSSGQSSWLLNGDVLWFLWGTNWVYICYVEENRPPLCYSGQSSWLHNGDVLRFLWVTNWIYICYVEESRTPLWPSGQSSWLQIQRSGFDSRCYQIFWEVVGLERGPLSLVSTIEELLGRNSRGSCQEIRHYGRRESAALTTRHPSINKSWH
jgi:hypothetical protein